MGKNSDLLTAKGAKEIDRRALDSFGIPGLLLMENAAIGVAQEAVRLLRAGMAAALFCGKGNNGGDGFAAARHLLTRGIKPELFLAGSAEEVKGDAKVNLDIILKMRRRVIEVNAGNLREIKDKIRRYGLIIDALLGTGLKGEVKGVYRDLVGIINSSKAYVISVDIPSGLDATTGRILGCCVKADKTVTFAAKKRGMVMAEGPAYCGKIVVKDLGLPVSLIKNR